jgi:HSP20 family protein
MPSRRKQEPETAVTPFRREMESLLGDWRWPRLSDFWETELMSTPRIELSETDDEVVIRAQVPGIEKDDLDIEVLDGSLNIRGETRQREEEKKRSLYRSEFRYGAFSRTIPLPTGVEPSKAEAKLESGVLELHVPKADEAKKHARRIAIR